MLRSADFNNLIFSASALRYKILKMVPAKQMLLCIVVLRIWTLPLAHEAAHEGTKCHCIKRDNTRTLQQLTQLDVPEKGVSIRIMDKIGSDYHTLGTYLLNDEDGSKIKTIKHDHRLTADILHEIFHLWIKGRQMKNGKKTNTWEKLIKYLKYAGLVALADEIKTILQFCSEITMRMNNSEECAIEYNDHKHHNEVPLQCHGYGECECIGVYKSLIAPIEAIFHLQFFMLVGLVVIVIVAAAIYHCKADSKSLTSTPRNNIFLDGIDVPEEPMPEVEDIIIMEDTKSEMKIRIIQKSTPNLISAISPSVDSAADHCLSTGLISEMCYKSVVEHNGNEATKARRLLQAVKSAITTDHDCFGVFLHRVLPKVLSFREASKLRSNMEEQYTKSLYARQRSYQDSKVLSVLQYRCSVVREPEIIRFNGRLATRRFQRIDKAFQVAIHAGQVENVESAAEVMSNINPDYKAIGLLYRASCRVLIAGRVNEALADCDRAIKVAKPMECQNGVLITLRALRMKLSILRTEGQLEKASDCLQKARGLFSSVAPSYDSAAFLYEEIRLKLITEDKTTYSQSDIQLDYERTLRHVDCSAENDFSQVFIFSNSRAESLLKSSMIRDEERLSPAPTEQDLSKAEKILNNLPINQLPEEAYVYRGWHYLTRSDLYTWRKQYAEAKEWAKKSLEQFARGGVSYATDVVRRRLKLLKRLKSQN